MQKKTLNLVLLKNLLIFVIYQMEIKRSPPREKILSPTCKVGLFLFPSVKPHPKMLKSKKH